MAVRGSRRAQEVIDQAMRSALAFFLVSTAVSISSTALRAAEVLRATVTVRVYQTAGLPSALEEGALAEAEAVLRAARMDVQWRMCAGEAGEHSAVCNAIPEPSELLLRMIRAPRQDTSAALGSALVDRRAGGVLATVYVNRVVSLANAAGTDPALLLGRVTAHELGHLLMRGHAHRRLGLMRPSWTHDEVQRNRAADWLFTAADVAAMRQP